MTIRISTLILLLMIAINLLIGCSVVGQKTAIEPKPTADYIGDPYLWIPDIEYMIGVVQSRQMKTVSSPVIPAEKQKRIREIFFLDLTKEQKDRMEIEMLVEGLTDLDATKYLLTSYYNRMNVSTKSLDGYTQLYAQKALDTTPNDFTTLYVWTVAHPHETTALPVYRKLLKIMPNSKRVLHRLADYLFRHYYFSEEEKGHSMIEEAVDFLIDEQQKEIYTYLYDQLSMPRGQQARISMIISFLEDFKEVTRKKGEKEQK